MYLSEWSCPLSDTSCHEKTHDDVARVKAWRAVLCAPVPQLSHASDLDYSGLTVCNPASRDLLQINNHVELHPSQGRMAR